MAEFKAIRHDGISDVPVADGQMLVDKTNSTIAFDVGTDRVSPNYVYGIYEPVTVNTWIPTGNRYYIDVTTLVSSKVPDGYTIVSANLVSGTNNVVAAVEHGYMILYSDDRRTGNLIVTTIPGSSSDIDNTQASDGLIALYHFDHTDSEYMDVAGGTSVSVAQGSGEMLSKFGCRSVLLSSVGYMDISNLPTLQAFTVEWWQYDPNENDDGGSVCFGNIEIPSISKYSSNYFHGEWKHIALVRKHGSDVYIYINGRLVGFSNVTGDITADPIRFYGSNRYARYIDELAIFNYARYNGDFDVPTAPYVGSNEITIAITSDIKIENCSDMFSETVNLPIECSDDTAELTVARGNSPADLSVFIDGDTVNITAMMPMPDPWSFSMLVTHPMALGKLLPVSGYPGSIPEEGGSGGADIEARVEALEADTSDIASRVEALEDDKSDKTTRTTYSSSSVTISRLEAFKLYECTNAITSLKVTSLGNGYDEATIIFTTGSTFTASFPSTLQWVSEVSFGTGTKYVVVICGSIAVASEVL